MNNVSKTFKKSHYYFVPETFKPECWTAKILYELWFVGLHDVMQPPRSLLRSYLRYLENPTLHSKHIYGLLDRYRKIINFSQMFTSLKLMLVSLLECIMQSFTFDDDIKKKLANGIKMLKGKSRESWDHG